MTTAREIMTPDAQCVGEDQTLTDAARMMRELDVGALPICGKDDRLKGMITDRDITIGCVAEGKDPDTVKAGEYGGDELVTIGADDDISEALHTMMDHQIRRLPVIDGHRLVGMVCQADLARALPPKDVGELVEAVSRH
jgi:CBS domain-containing protein